VREREGRREGGREGGRENELRSRQGVEEEGEEEKTEGRREVKGGLHIARTSALIRVITPMRRMASTRRLPMQRERLGLEEKVEEDDNHEEEDVERERGGGARGEVLWVTLLLGIIISVPLLVVYGR